MVGLLDILALVFVLGVCFLVLVGFAATIRFLVNAVQGGRARGVGANPPHEGELHDLEVTTRTIQQLLARGDLDPGTAEHVGRCLALRRRALQPQPLAPDVHPVRSVLDSTLGQLEALLGEGRHPRDLPPETRRQALACYRRLTVPQRAALNPPVLLALARLLDMAGMTSHALDTYRRLLDEHPQFPNHASIALEAARFAVHNKLEPAARRFLNQALAGVLPEAEQAEAQALRHRLEELVQAPGAVAAAPVQEIPEVLPVSSPSHDTGFQPAGEMEPPAAPAAVPALVSAPPRRRRSLMSLLAAFMEERNILWGELTGGLLIVGCSIALVITLWHSIESLPYFPFLIFASITAALFGAGEYTLHHWKLESTSRGLLVIALLLVPLNLLVLADPSLGHAGPALEWSFKTVALLLSLGMVRLAGRDLIGVGVLPGPIDRRWLFVLAVVGTAGSQLLMPALLNEEQPSLFIGLGCVPVVCHLLACSAVVAGLARARARCENKQVETRQANALFVFLGLSSFALFVALGFLLSRSSAVALMLPRLAEPFALASVPILAGGLLVWRGLPREEAGPRTAGAGVAFTGLGFMLAAVVLAWPQPWPLLLVCLSNAVLLTLLAFRWRLPYAHAVALPCLTLAVLLIVQMASGHVAFAPAEAAGWRLAEQLTSPSSGIVLAILMVLSTAGAETLARFGERGHAVSYAFGAGMLAVCALLTTACHGIESPWPAAAVHGLSAMCVLALHVRWRRLALPYIGLSLLVAASLWILWALAPHNLALWGFVVALESAVLALAAIPSHSLRDSCRTIAAITAALGLGLAVLTPQFPAQGWHTGTAALLALSALVLAFLDRHPGLTWYGSALLFAAVAHFLIWDLGDAAPERPLLMALLAHATLALLGGLLLRTQRWDFEPVLSNPLLYSAAVTSLLAVPILMTPGIAVLVLAGYTLWLSALWLTAAVLWRSPPWFSAFQLAVSMAVVFAVSAWLPEWSWFDPYTWQVFGLALGLLGLGWIAARMALSGNALARELWEAPWPSLDRATLAALVVGQFALAVWGIMPGVDAELIPAGYVEKIGWPRTASHAYGPGAWALLALLTLVLLAALREKGRTSIIISLLVLAATVPVLAAGPFAADLATASALRWGLALCYLVCSVLLWMRQRLARLATSAGVTFTADHSAVPWSQGVLAGMAAVVFLLTMQVAELGFSGLHPTGPASTSLFAQMGWTLSHVIPLLLLTVGLVGHAVRERSPVYAFVGGLLANISLAGGYALAVVTSGQNFEIEDLVCVGQLASLAAALWAGGWQASGRWVDAWREDPSAEGFAPSMLAAPLMRVQLGLALAVQLVILSFGILSLSESSIFGEPSLTLPARSAIGSPLGWLALLTSLAALFFRFVRQHRPLPWGWLFAGGLAVVSLLACTAERLAAETGFYYLLLGWPLYVLLWSLLVHAIAPHIPARYRDWLDFTGMKEAALVLLLPCLAAVLWALSAAAFRQEYLWAAEAVSLCAAAAAVLALWTRGPLLVWISGLLVDLIGVLFWWGWGADTAVSFLLTQALGLAVAAAIWIGIALWQQWEDRPAIAFPPHIALVRFAANAALALVVLIVLLLLGSDLQPPRIAEPVAFAWITLAVVAVALAAAWWERDSFATPGLYVLGLVAVGLALHEGTHSPAGLGWCAALALAGYAVFSSFVVGQAGKPDLPKWFLPAQGLVASGVIVLSLWMCLDFAVPLDRLAGPGAVLLLIPAALLLLGRPSGDNVDLQRALRSIVLILGAIVAAEIAWACPDPDVATPWLHRNVLLMVALAGMTALYGVALPRWLLGHDEWVRCGRRFGPILGILASLTLLVLLVQEFRLYDAATRRTPMLWPEILVIIAALVVLMISGVRFAVVAGRDPFGLSERGRTLYVYAVELLLVLFFVHLRLTVPVLFRGWLAAYWPFFVMLIAFCGVGLSEFFERRKLRVLAEPLQRTGVFLPLLPLLAFWVRPSASNLPPLLHELQRHPHNLNSYALLWMLVCGLYSLLSLTRRSTVFALLAALAGNFALWSLLAHHGIAFVLHPQCWLIPPALIVLAAEHVNRERLRPDVSAGLRYLGITMIYVSSTADLFIAGLGKSVALPIVLAVLSVTGILLGILFRVRAFLFLGISFLFLDVFTMIWYAAVDRYQTWLWWVSGIVLGAAILTLFAVFEKRRNDVLKMLEDIKNWD